MIERWLVFALCCACVAAQPRWQDRSPELRNRSSHAAAWDSARGRLVVFGGATPAGSQLLGDTWEWDGTTWWRMAPARSPSARSDHAMCYDPVRQRVVLFGGNLGTVGGLDTWEWDGAQWLQLAWSSTAPSQRYGHSLVFDPVRQRSLLFGGRANAGAVNDTFEWDGAAWTPRTPAQSPPARYGAGLAYDAVRGRAVLFGGSSNVAQQLDDTWEWDGSNWITLAPASRPSKRTGASLSYAQGRTVLFGGWDGAALRALS